MLALCIQPRFLPASRAKKATPRLIDVNEIPQTSCENAQCQLFGNDSFPRILEHFLTVLQINIDSHSVILLIFTNNNINSIKNR